MPSAVSSLPQAGFDDLPPPSHLGIGPMAGILRCDKGGKGLDSRFRLMPRWSVFHDEIWGRAGELRTLPRLSDADLELHDLSLRAFPGRRTTSMSCCPCLYGRHVIRHTVTVAKREKVRSGDRSANGGREDRVQLSSARVYIGSQLLKMD